MDTDLRKRLQRQRLLVIVAVAALVCVFFAGVLLLQHQIIANQVTIKTQDVVLLSNQESGRALIDYEIRLGRISIENQQAVATKVGTKVQPAPPAPKTSPVRTFDFKG